MSYDQGGTTEFTQPKRMIDVTQLEPQKKTEERRVKEIAKKTQDRIKGFMGAKETPKISLDGPIYGYRYMDLAHDGTGFRLKSPLAPGNRDIYPAGGDPGPAVCKAGKTHEDPVPVSGCSCGYHVKHTEEEARKYAGQFGGSSGNGGKEPIIAEAHMHGKMFKHSDGFRAARIKLTGVKLPGAECALKKYTNDSTNQCSGDGKGEVTFINKGDVASLPWENEFYETGDHINHYFCALHAGKVQQHAADKPGMEVQPVLRSQVVKDLNSFYNIPVMNSDEQFPGQAKGDGVVPDLKDDPKNRF